MPDSANDTMAAINRDEAAEGTLPAERDDDPIERHKRLTSLPEPGPEELARALAGVPGYRVLRELTPRTVFSQREDCHALRALVVDIETTGLDPVSDEIIEVAILPFEYTAEGEVLRTGTPFLGLRQPSKPIPPAVTRLTGITDATVAGLSISPEAIDEFIGDGCLIVCHHAAFDRPFFERLCPRFRDQPWACSLTQIKWADEGFAGARLRDLVLGHDAYFNAHRAIDDCRALLEVLARPLPASGATGLAVLLQEARKPSFRVWAVGAKFDSRNLLRSSGYRWNSGDDGRRRAWSKEVGAGELEAELDFLTTFFFDGCITPAVEELNAFRRFSARA